MKKVFLSLAFITLLILSGFSQSCSLDNNFGLGGKVTTDFNGSTDNAYSLAIQPDGKIIAAGEVYTGSSWDFGLVRYKTNGTLDNTFGTGGKVTTDFAIQSIDYANAIALQTDGKIIAVGGTKSGSNYDVAIARYNTDGSLDQSFGTNGKVTTSFGSGDNTASAVAVQPDGKIVVAGTMYNGNDDDFEVLRYNSDGTLDNSFGVSGKMNVDFGALQISNNDYGRGVAVQPDGKIIVVGYSDNGVYNHDIAIARFTTSGGLDNSFSSDGQVLTDYLGSTDDFAYGVALQPDGKIVVAGRVTYGQYRAVLLRYTSTGSLDNTFSSDGGLIVGWGSSGEQASAVLVQPNGQIVVAGSYSNGSNADFAWTRFDANGTLDNTCGKVTTPFGSSDENAFAVAMQSDQKIVVAGFTNNGSNHDFAVARYNASGTVGLDDGSNEEDAVSVYPSPATDYLNVETNGRQVSRVTIYTLAGVLIRDIQNPQNKNLDIRQLTPGMYIAEIQTEGVSVKRRWVKM